MGLAMKLDQLKLLYIQSLVMLSQLLISKLKTVLINRLDRLTKKLLVLDLQTLNDLAGSNPELRKILSVKLFRSIDDCREAILASIPRLKHLLWEFEKQSKDSKRVWAFYNHFRTHSQGFNTILLMTSSLS
eukprot:TRINITY_DN1825_c0_g1_i2.p1 TRINITY_DN1825_c0_g1~~TRINITY_DN1825_c0_g1_i2.p1  ORF type:complete len:131 (+),score=10.06 TRINITY_DN1825_c0_g1_i2:105-497(+)